MIIIKVMGGLGNQMQQYALYEKFRWMGTEAKLDISWFEDAAQQENVLAKRELELRLFDGLRFETCSKKEREALAGRKGLPGKVMKKLYPGGNRVFCETEMYHPRLLQLTDRYLEGHWACEKYYHDILPLLREKIKFPGQSEMERCSRAEENSDYKQLISRKDDEKADIKADIRKMTEVSENNRINLNIMTMNRMKAENSVSIHIRRGDYLDPVNAKMFGGICTEEYYRAAETYIRERVENVHFYLFSDDTAYLRQNYQGEEYTIVDWNKGKNSFYDMELMSCCRHNICANSTFSFWGARLNGSADKIMIRPLKHKNGQTVRPEVMQELWEDWVLIDETGKNL